MKFSFILIFIFFISLFKVSSQDKKFQNVLNQLNDFVYIQQASHIKYLHRHRLSLTKKDSLLVHSSTNFEKKSVKDFMISDHEVTVSEYMKFVSWVKDSIKSNQKNTPDDYSLYYSFVQNDNETKRVMIHPDTLIYRKEYLHFITFIGYSKYFCNDKYDDYPVIGVSWEQAMAYTHWLNRGLEDLLTTNGFDRDLCYFKLPNEAEWVYAAIGWSKNSYSPYYPWSGNSIFIENGNYKANLGKIIDENGTYIKANEEDGYPYTSPIKSFPSNPNGVYDLAGNVSEWVSDEKLYFKDSITIKKEMKVFFPRGSREITWNTKGLFGVGYEFFIKDTVLFNKIVSEILTYNPDWNTIKKEMNDSINYELLRIYYEKLERDNHLLSNPDNRIVKGGSWDAPPVYMQCANRQVLKKHQCSSKIGFRVAIEISEKFKDTFIKK